MKRFNRKLASERIAKYIIECKNKGVKKIGILEASQDLKLPVEQVDEIMEKFKERGLKEV